MTGSETPSSACTRRPDEISADGFSSSSWPEQFPAREAAAAAAAFERGEEGRPLGARYLCDPQWFRDTAIRGPTTIAAPESQFRTCPTDHDNIGYPRMSASGESSTTMHRLLHASGSHPIPPPDDPNSSAKYPVDKETAVARSVVTKYKQQLSEQLLNNQLKNIQSLQAINAQDGKKSMAEI
ncbi:hypothetical protein F511_08838 [Dorcoceras hygrometricum]|uniref:Uncharacterized protein n=1 Tax=Dorcoceras hygrometricum TaxID=472368 RepID=A0A2Z7AGU0_9LAMI|nr:hypothetical protein F511_08838 [Dorcoceras hygrometricum]